MPTVAFSDCNRAACAETSDGFANLADLEREIQTDGLLHLDFDGGTGHGPESRMFNFDVVDAGRDRGESVKSFARGVRSADCIGGGVG